MFKFFRHSLASKISLFTSLLVLMTALLVTYVFFITSRDILIEKEFQLLKDQSILVRDKVLHLSKFFDKQIDALKKLSLHLDDSRAVLSKTEYEKVFKHELKSWAFGQEHGTTITFLAHQSKGKISNRKSLNFDLSKQTKAELRDKRERVLPVELAMKSGALIKAKDKTIPLLHYVVTLPTQSVLVTFQLQNFFNNFMPHRASTNTKLGSIIFFNKRGQIISHPNNDKVFSIGDNPLYTIYDDFPFLQRISLSSDNSLHSQLANYRGRKQLASVNKANFINFMLIISEQKIFDNLSETIYQLGVMLSGLVIFFTFLGWFLSRFLLKELSVITNIAKRFMDGEHNLVIPINSSDEIGTLAITIQGLIRQVQEREKNLKRSERRTREARDQAEMTLESKSSLLEDLRIQKRDIENISKDKDDLLAIVSHDLKNPLSVVDTSMDVILEEDHEILSQVSKDLIRRSKSSTQMALTLITDLLDLARLEGEIKLDLETFYVNDLIHQVVDAHYHIIEKKQLKVMTEFSHDFDLNADYGRMNQVVANILGNACKFTPEHGTIHIHVSKDKVNDESLYIKISDDGPGIPEDKVDSIFNKYEQARAGDRKIGTGLGLAICQKICLLHHGKIWASINEDQGASFHIIIPGLMAHQSENIQDASSTDMTDINLNDDKMIMIVDDDKELRELVSEHFGDLDIKCFKAKSGAEALFLLNKYPIKVVITDIRVPDMDGATMVKTIKDSYQDISIILTSSHFDTISDKLVNMLGIIHIFSKPFDLDKLASTVRRDLLSQDKIVPLVTKTKTPSLQTARKDKDILVIDDSDDMHLLFDVLLKKEKDVKVDHVLEGKEGIAMCLQKSFDVIFIDMNMPGMSGEQTLSVLKKMCKDRNKSMPYAILLTAHDLDYEEVTIKMGFSDYIQKPINKKKILKALEAADEIPLNLKGAA